MAAPPLDAIYLDGEFNAAIRQHRRLGGKTRNVLWLGLPLLDMLSPSACRAILAHEYAHIAQRHGRYASRVYFARLQWQEVARRLDRRRRLSSAPLRLFVAWYVPRFLAVSLDFARQCEVQADAEAARVCGQPAMAEALSAMALQWRALRDAWPALLAASDPPRPYAALAARTRWPRLPTKPKPASGCTPPSAPRPPTAIHTRHWRIAWPRWRPIRPGRCRGAAPPPPPRRPGCPASVRPWRPGSTRAARRNRLTRPRRSARSGKRSPPSTTTCCANAASAPCRPTRPRAAPGCGAPWTTTSRAPPCWPKTGCGWRPAIPPCWPNWRAAASARGIHGKPRTSGFASRTTPARNNCPACASSAWRPCARATTHWPRTTAAGPTPCSNPPRADAADGYHPHDLSPAELGKLADTLDPLLRIATGAWLLRPAVGGRYRLLVLAREAALLRLIGRLTGEPSYLRRDCEQLLGRLLPRLRLDVEADIMAAGDPRLAWCVEQARVRRPA